MGQGAVPQQEAEWVERLFLPKQVALRNAAGWRLVHTVEPIQRSAVLVVWEKPAVPVGVSARALAWLASSPDPVIAGEATALIAQALGVPEEPVPPSPESPVSPEPPAPPPPPAARAWGVGSCGAAHEHRA